MMIRDPVNKNVALVLTLLVISCLFSTRAEAAEDKDETQGPSPALYAWLAAADKLPGLPVRRGYISI